MPVCKTPRAELGVLHGHSILDQLDVAISCIIEASATDLKLKSSALIASASTIPMSVRPADRYLRWCKDARPQRYRLDVCRG